MPPEQLPYITQSLATFSDTQWMKFLPQPSSYYTQPATDHLRMTPGAQYSSTVSAAFLCALRIQLYHGMGKYLTPISMFPMSRLDYCYIY